MQFRGFANLRIRRGGFFFSCGLQQRLKNSLRFSFLYYYYYFYLARDWWIVQMLKVLSRKFHLSILGLALCDIQSIRSFHHSFFSSIRPGIVLQEYAISDGLFRMNLSLILHLAWTRFHFLGDGRWRGFIMRPIFFLRHF